MNKHTYLSCDICKQVAKDVPAKQSTVSAVKNPCRGPNCGKASLLGSVYCSDICIQNHALESIRLIEQERQKSQPQRMKTEVAADNFFLAVI